ncbi:HAD-IIB family hydrolase [Paenibacillus chibensis]|uniref:HAD-IIB family hydrolase n=1 Tax=Paenibacillus chibensis TaxID=59846 RepID=UPI0013E2A3FC|nr:HAD-IIB family hydrolase [Paenibacillus chibensis]MEC0371432.1 HAD-IIB family hydrolase [Paenibacillus chibensis]
MDGTICFQGKVLSHAIIEALDALAHYGHDIIFASARPIRDLLPVLPPHMHAYPMVGGNGALVAKDKHIISTVHFKEEVMNKILSIIHSHQLAYLIDGPWDYAYTGREDHPIRKNIDPEKRANLVPLASLTSTVKIVLLDMPDRKTIMNELSMLPVVVHEHGDEGILDISPQGIDKWNGLVKLGIQERSYIAFGNDANDISMFQHALTSVIVFAVGHR